VVPVIGSGRIELDPIHVDDVCAVVAQCLTRGDVVGRTYDLLGPDRLTFNDFVDRLARRLARRPRRVHLPGGLVLLGASVLGRLMKSPPISTDNVVGMISPAVVDGAPARRDFPIRWRTLDEGLADLGPGGPAVSAPPPPPGAPPSPRPRRPVRVCIVGLGKMGLAHASVLANVPDCAIVGVSDHAPALGKSLRGMGHSAPWFATLEAMLAETKPDAVFVCAPQDAHWPLARVAIESGVAVFVEKPLAHTLADAEALAALSRSRGVPVACGYTLAYWPIFAAAHRALEEGAIGTVTGARGVMLLSQVFGPKRGWMYQASRSGGGVVANLSSHLLFLLEWFLGTPASVTATSKRLHGEVEDELAAELALPGGVAVHFESSWSVPGYPLSDVRVEIEGDNGRLEVSADGLRLDLRVPRGPYAAGITEVRPADLPQPARFELNGEGYYLEDAQFLEWITGGPEPPTSVEVALRVQRTMDALYRSAAGGGARVVVGP
jgi:predicted dehydrogenase